MGTGLAQGAYHHDEKRISAEQKIRTVKELIFFNIPGLMPLVQTKASIKALWIR
jgi:hypothetical protein